MLCLVGINRNDEEIRHWAKTRLLAYMLPNHYLKLNEFPLNNNGKIDRKTLTLHVHNELTSKSTYQAPKTELEIELTAIWEQVLNKSNIGVNDDFYRLGGQSLTAVKLHHELVSVLQYEVTMEETFQCKQLLVWPNY